MFDWRQRDSLTPAKRNRQAEIRSLIFDSIHQSLPIPSYSETDYEGAAHDT